MKIPGYPLKFNVHGSVHRKNILIYIQQDAMLHSLFYLETALHVSGGTSTHHQEHIQLYLEHLVFVTPLLLSAAKAAGSCNGVTNTRCCRYSCMRCDGGRYQPKNIEQFPDKINCVTLHIVRYILEYHLKLHPNASFCTLSNLLFTDLTFLQHVI
jgi:hypothetical protein